MFAHDEAQSCFPGGNLIDEQRMGEWRGNKRAAALTDLFSWTFPAESHLSELLPAVRGLRAPDKTTQDTASSQRLRKQLCVLQLWCRQTGRHACPCTSVHKYWPPVHTYMHLSFVLEHVCADMSNAVFSSNYDS